MWVSLALRWTVSRVNAAGLGCSALVPVQTGLISYISASNSFHLMGHTLISNEWYCMQCRGFLPLDQFKSGPKRWVCRRHYNEKWHRVKTEQWKKDPLEKQANIIWQVAYRDSITVFQLKIEITQAQVLQLLQEHSISTNVRLLPLEPKRPLSMGNFILASLAIRKVMCRVWKQFECTTEYGRALDQAEPVKRHP